MSNGTTNESTRQMELANSPIFHARVQYMMMQYSRVALAEAWDVPGHSYRANLANRVLANPLAEAKAASVMIVGGPNLIGTVIGEGETCDSSATDSAIFAQIADYWNPLAGWQAQTPTPPAL